MAGDRIAQALDRIDAAARRIEAAAKDRTPAADPQLERRYQTLRTQAAAALDELDQLIGSIQR